MISASGVIPFDVRPERAAKEFPSILIAGILATTVRFPAFSPNGKNPWWETESFEFFSSKNSLLRSQNLRKKALSAWCLTLTV